MKKLPQMVVNRSMHQWNKRSTLEIMILSFFPEQCNTIPNEETQDLAILEVVIGNKMELQQ